MGSELGEAFVTIRASLDQLDRDLAPAKSKIAKTLEGLEKGMQAIGTIAFTGAIAGIAALGAGLAVALNEAMGAQEIMAQTEAVIKSTGGAAGLSAEAVAKLGTALSEQSRFSDDAIQSGENLLLTFTNIGKDTFPLATQAMVDMATSMGTDVKSQAIALGKALNDPVAGISALSRVGVTFTEDQKSVIKAMVATGNTAGAQQVILAELNKEFGGSAAAAAETFAGKMDVLKNKLLNVAEGVGMVLLPILSDLVDNVITPAIPIITAIGEALGGIFADLAAGDPGAAFDSLRESIFTIGQSLGFSRESLGSFISTLTKVVTGVQDMWAALTSNDPQAFFAAFEKLFTDLSAKIGPMVEGVVKTIQGWIVDNGPGIIETLKAWGLAFVSWVAPMIPPLLEKVGELATQLQAWVQSQVPVWIAQLQEWGEQFVAWVSPMIPPLLARAQELGEQLLAWVQAQVPVWLEQLKKWGEQFVAWIGPMIPPLIAEAQKLGLKLDAWIIEKIAELAGQLLKWGTEFVEWIGPQIGPMLAEAGKFLGRLTAWLITTGVPELIEKLKEWGKAFVEWVGKDVIPKIGPALNDFLLAVGEIVVTKLVPGFIGFAKGFVGGLLEGFNTSIPELVENVKGIGKSIVDGIVAGINAAPGAVLQALGSIVDAAIAAIRAKLGLHSPSLVFAGLGEDTMRGFVEGLESMQRQVERTMNKMIVSPTLAPAFDLDRMVSVMGLVGEDGGPTSNSTHYNPVTTIQVTPDRLDRAVRWSRHLDKLGSMV